MGIAAAGDLDHLFDDMGRRRLVRITHAKVDNILSAASCGEFEIVYLVENVRRKTLDPRELFSQNRYTVVKRRSVPQSRPRYLGTTRKCDLR